MPSFRDYQQLHMNQSDIYWNLIQNLYKVYDR